MKTIKVKDLMSIAGKGGLFRYLAQARSGIVVESLTEGKRTIAPPTARVSALEDISIFAENEDVPLADVMMKIHEKEDGRKAIDQKSGNEELKAYFAEVLPEYDDERVYVSDIKKVISWYNLLHELKMLEVVDKEEKDDSENNKEQEKETKKETKKEAKKEDKKEDKKEAGKA